MSERTVSVSASGHVSATPDIASINTGVLTEASTAREAMNANSTAMTKLVEGIKAQGIDPRDIRTTGINVNPRYSTPRDGRPAVITGYSANNQVRIVVRDLKRLGEVLDAAISLGATQMSGISFEVSQAETLKDEARKSAMANARRRAELYAAAAGASVGNVIAISEDVQVEGPRPVLMGRAKSAAPAAMPIEVGSMELEAVVHVTWGLK